jgi:ABC-type Fe3+ transport system permease subunit
VPIEKLNPLHYMGQEAYAKFWEKLFNTILYGFWGRFFFVVLVALSFWVGVRQRNPTLAAICLVLAAIIAYGGGLVDVITSISR